MFVPSDPDELVHQLKLLQFEKVGGNDNPQLNGPIIAITDMLLEYNKSTSKHYKHFSLRRICCWIKDCVLFTRFFTNPIFFYHFYPLTSLFLLFLIVVFGKSKYDCDKIMNMQIILPSSSKKWIY